MFSRKGVFVFDKETGVTEDQLMEVALEAGADDIVEYEDSFEVTCEPDVFNDVNDALKAAGIEPMEADVEMVPSVESTPTDESAIKSLKKMIEILEDDDDVQKVYTNCTIDLYE